MKNNHENVVIDLLTRKNGATIHDLKKTGYKHSAMSAIQMVGRRGFNRAIIIHRPGILTRYYAFKSTFKGRK